MPLQSEIRDGKENHKPALSFLNSPEFMQSQVKAFPKTTKESENMVSFHQRNKSSRVT